MMTEQVIKIIGYSATAIGMGASIVSGIVEDKKMNFVIEKKVKEEIAKLKR